MTLNFKLCRLYRLDSLEKFTVEVNQGLNKKLEEGDIDGLLEVMSYLSKVKDRQQKTDEMFEPLKHIIELLKQYQEELPENVHAQIQVYIHGLMCL